VAQDYIDRYFARYPRVRAWLDATLEEGRRAGFVKTMFGRRRYVPDLASKNRVLASSAERIAVNAPIQGSAADLMKLAMIRVSRRLKGGGAKLILQVHDELVLEAPEAEADRAAEIVRAEMENAHPMSVPLQVVVSRGADWAGIS
jgi:DNA polymerase-1